MVQENFVIRGFLKVKVLYVVLLFLILLFEFTYTSSYVNFKFSSSCKPYTSSSAMSNVEGPGLDELEGIRAY